MKHAEDYLARFCDAWDRFVESPSGVLVGWIWLAIVWVGIALSMGWF